MTIALWCVLVAGLLPQMVGLYAKASKDFDNNNPREYLAKLDGKRARAVAAMANGYEGLPLFAAAVIIAHILQGEQSSANLLAAGYIASRIAYGVLYIAGLGTLRSVVWIAGLSCVIGLFVVAA